MSKSLIVATLLLISQCSFAGYSYNDNWNNNYNNRYDSNNISNQTQTIQNNLNNDLNSSHDNTMNTLRDQTNGNDLRPNGGL